MCGKTFQPPTYYSCEFFASSSLLWLKERRSAVIASRSSREQRTDNSIRFLLVSRSTGRVTRLKKVLSIKNCKSFFFIFFSSFLILLHSITDIIIIIIVSPLILFVFPLNF